MKLSIEELLKIVIAVIFLGLLGAAFVAVNGDFSMTKDHFLGLFGL